MIVVPGAKCPQCKIFLWNCYTYCRCGCVSEVIPVQAQKVYVQDRLRESGDLVWKLLEDRGHFYVCGDAAHMAGSVERALLQIIESHQVCQKACHPSQSSASGGRFNG